MLRFTTAGESHGSALIVILEGYPAGVRLDPSSVDRELARRQAGHGRGPRMKIECDRAEFVSGVRYGETLGSPIAIRIPNRDWTNWEQTLSPWGQRPDDAQSRPVERPRPGHADLAGGLKYGHTDLRNVLERASARETAARVAAGSLCSDLLSEFGINVRSHVVEIGGAAIDSGKAVLWEQLDHEAVDASPVRCPEPVAAQCMVEVIDEAGERGDTLGGRFEVRARGVPAGLGSYSSWETRLDANLSFALMSIPAIKAVEVGAGIQAARLPGSRFHDPIRYAAASGYLRDSNNAGGIEGGVSNGEEIVVRATMKPIPTLRDPLPSVNIRTRRPEAAPRVRGDVCAVPAASVIGEAMTAFVLARAFLEKFGGDSLQEIRPRFDLYREQLAHYPSPD